MADLRIIDAPEIPTEDITGEEKLPTGGSGNYSISLDSLADYTKTKKDLVDNTTVDNKVNGVRQELNVHIEDLLNPHQVTKGQIGLGNVDNTADADKPVSNSTQAAIISAVSPKADKTYVDGQLTLKANSVDVYTKSETYTKQESSDLVSSNISTALTPINSSLDLAKRGIANRYDSLLTYNSGERVVLANGDIVKSTIDGNTNDPNVDMTGWDYETKRQDFKKKTIFDYMTGFEIKAFENSAPRTFDFTDIINNAVSQLNTSFNGTTQSLYFPAIAGGYLTTSCVWLPKCVVLVGDGATMWNTDLDNVNLKSSMIYADFADKNQWIISSDTKLLSTGIRLAHNAYFTGANSDSKLYSFCDGIQIIGLQIHAKNRVFGGVRLFGSVGSYISHDTVVTNCEYGYLTSASWVSNHLGSSKYGKCGYLGYDQNNSTEVAGYHNPIGSVDVSFVNMLNFFQDDYDIPFALMNTHSKQFGVVVKKADNIKLDVTCEKADFNVVLDDRVRGSGNLYLEVPNILGLVLGNQCEFNLIGCGGAIKDADVIQLGYNSILVAPTYAFLIENGNHMYRGMPWSPTASAQLPSKYFTQYHQNIVWSDKHDNIVYISPTGLDSSNGASPISPTNLTQAIKRISNEVERYDNTLKVSGNKAVVFYLIEGGEYTLNEAYLSLFGRISIKKRSTLSINNTILNMTNFVYLANCEVDISSVTLKIPNVTYDYVTWARNAPFLSYRGINSLVLNDVITEFKGVNNGILSYANGSDAINTLSIAGGAISGAGLLVQTPESPETGGTTNITVGSSCSVDALIKGKDNGGIGIPIEQQGNITVPWLLKNASVTYDPPSLPSGQQQSTTVTLTGAVVGKPISCAFSEALSGTRMWAEVSSKDTVTVYHRNDTGATVNLASGTLSVKKI